ncbi:MAG TPA: hypothetical protein VKX39_13915 [Bryobacteraceae bacterium]|nr:hypothetical protein [Bryobacteraceae bacterium]
MRQILLIAVTALAVACSRDIQNPEAVKQGVLQYLDERKAQTGLDPAQMQIDIGSLSFEKDEARASVIFRPKNQPDPQPMSITYVLDRKGNQWVVRPHAASSGNPHGAEMPPGHFGAAEGRDGTLPPGHPAIPEGSRP